MKGLSKILILSGLLFFLFSCEIEPQELSADAYHSWYQKHSSAFESEKTINNIVYNVKLIPYEVLLLESDTIDYADYQAKVKENKGLFKIVLSIRVPGKIDPLRYKISNQEAYNMRLNYFSFDVKHDIYIEVGQQKFLCTDVMFMRSYGLKPEIEMILNIPINYHIQDLSDMTFVLNDVVFGSGLVKIKLDTDILNNIPKLIEE